MIWTVVLAAYITLAGYIAAYCIQHGVLRRRPTAAFTLGDRLVLVFTAIAVGIFWPLFVPSLTIWSGRLAARYIHARSRTWVLPRAKEARVRG